MKENSLLQAGIELICEFPKQCLTITKTCLIVSACLASLQKFLKGKVAHLYSAARALAFKSESGSFHFSTNLDKDFFRCLLC